MLEKKRNETVNTAYHCFQGARLPKLSQQFMQAKPVFARILFMPGEDKLNRFGVFQCKIVKDSVATEIVTLKLPPFNEGKN